MTVLLGPCRCKGCGGEVIYVVDGPDRGWLHESGSLLCVAARATGPRPYAWRHRFRRVPPTLVPFIEWRRYMPDDPVMRRKRLWMRELRAMRRAA